MFFAKTVLISVLGLSALAVAAPVENGVAVEATPAAPCSWLDNILGRDCNDDDEQSTPAPRPTSRPAPRPAGPVWGNSSPSQNNNPYPNQPSTPAPVASNPRPANGQRPRPVNGPRPITAPNNDGTDALGSSSWCNRPDPARRPASCTNGGATTAPRSNGSKQNGNRNGQNDGESQDLPEFLPEEAPVEEDQN